MAAGSRISLVNGAGAVGAFVVQNLTGKDIFIVAWTNLPFFFPMVVATMLTTDFSEIILNLLKAMMAR